MTLGFASSGSGLFIIFDVKMKWDNDPGIKINLLQNELKQSKSNLGSGLVRVQTLTK